MHTRKLFLISMVLCLAALACRLPAGSAPFPEWFGKTDVEVVQQNKQIVSEDPVYELDLVWPNLEGEEEQVVAFNLEVNTWILELEELYVADFEDSASLFEDDLFGGQSWLSSDYSISLFQDDLISVFCKYEVYVIGAAHPGGRSKTFNYDLRTGRFLKLEDLFLPAADALGMIVPPVEEALIQREIGYWEGTAEKAMTARENWNLLPEGLQINFDEYDVAAYAVGPQSVIIPWTALEAILDFEGPVGRIVSP